MMSSDANSYSKKTNKQLSNKKGGKKRNVPYVPWKITTL